MRDPLFIEVNETSAVGEVRRIAARLAAGFEFGDEDASRLALVATELATNLTKHASGGMLFAGEAETGGETVEILSLDRGPGIADVGKALRDGHSTTGTSGTGLGAISRLADVFELYSQVEGTSILTRVRKRKDATDQPPPNVGAVALPIRGEEVNGDGWAWSNEEGRCVVMLADGLGHGLLAHEASQSACEAFLRSKGSPSTRLRSVHDAIQHTRGAAVAIAELDVAGSVVRFAGVGNISALMIDPAARRSAVSLHGIVGHVLRDVREFTYPWSRDSHLIMHTDGLHTRWDLDSYPGLLAKDPALIAGTIWKDHRRQNDDSTVVVARTP